MRLRANLPTHKEILSMTELEVAEALREDDLWLQRYPTSDSYITALLYELGLEGATISTLFELYANEIDPEDVIRLWHIYNDNEWTND
jgi:hypothetical protein